MAKKRKTRKQKIASSIRQEKELQVTQTEQTPQHGMPENPNATPSFSYTYKPSRTPQATHSSQGSQTQLVDIHYLSRDLRKVLMVTGALVVLELILYSFIHMS